MTSFFKSVHCDLLACWADLLATTGVPWSDEPPWYVDNSSQVVDAVRHFNSTNMRHEEFREGGGWHGYDVVRLYTTIDLADLIEVLTKVCIGMHIGVGQT